MRSPRVKTLAIKSLTALASVDPDIFTQERVAKAVEPRLHDGEEAVAKAALEACLGLSLVSKLFTFVLRAFPIHNR